MKDKICALLIAVGLVVTAVVFTVCPLALIIFGAKYVITGIYSNWITYSFIALCVVGFVLAVVYFYNELKD